MHWLPGFLCWLASRSTNGHSCSAKMAGSQCQGRSGAYCQQYLRWPTAAMHYILPCDACTASLLHAYKREVHVPVPDINAGPPVLTLSLWSATHWRGTFNVNSSLNCAQQCCMIALASSALPHDCMQSSQCSVAVQDDIHAGGHCVLIVGYNDAEQVCSRIDPLMERKTCLLTTTGSLIKPLYLWMTATCSTT